MGYVTTTMALMVADGQGTIRPTKAGEKAKATIKTKNGFTIHLQAPEIEIRNFRKVHIVSDKYFFGSSGTVEFANSILTILNETKSNKTMTLYQCAEYLDRYFNKQWAAQKLPTESQDLLLVGFDTDKNKFGQFWFNVNPFGSYSILRYNPTAGYCIPIFIGSGGPIATEIYTRDNDEFSRITQMSDIGKQIKSLIKKSSEIIHEVSKRDSLVNDECFYTYISEITNYRIIAGKYNKK